MTERSETDETLESLPPIRRPVMFHVTVFVSFSLLALAILALIL